MAHSIYMGVQKLVLMRLATATKSAASAGLAATAFWLAYTFPQCRGVLVQKKQRTTPRHALHLLFMCPKFRATCLEMKALAWIEATRWNRWDFVPTDCGL